MTEQEAIENIENYIKKCNYTWSVKKIFNEYLKYLKGAYISHTANDVIQNCHRSLEKIFNITAINALKEVQQYREMDRKLRAAYGDCDGLLEKSVDLLCAHAGIDIGEPIKARLLTDENVDKWDAYREIGTAEECREAVEKQKAMKPKEILRHRGGFEIQHCPNCNMDYQVDRRYEITDGYCPVCGKLLDSVFKNHCANCGQAIENENLEEMENE